MPRTFDRTSLSLLLSLALAPPLLTGCPTLFGDDDDDDSAGDDDDATGDDDDATGAGPCDGAVPIGCGESLSGTNAGGPSDFDSYSCSDPDFDSTGPEAYYRFDSTVDGEVRITLTHDDPEAEDLDLFVVQELSGGGGCDDGLCVGASQTGDSEHVTFEATDGSSWYLVVDGYEGSVDDFTIAVSCSPVTYPYIVVRSRTATQADLDTNTPGPDLDAVEIFDVFSGASFWAGGVTAVQGAAGTAGNSNADPQTVLGGTDAFIEAGPGIDCVVSDDASGDARYWSMGSGDSALGDEGWVVAEFAGVAAVPGDVVAVYEVGSLDCDNIPDARDDAYEAYVCTDAFDPATATLADLDGALCANLGTSDAAGGITDFDVP